MIRADSSRIQPTLKLLKYFFSHVEINPDIVYKGIPCWLWIGKPFHGYGRFKAQKIRAFAHVAACRMFVGAINEELSCDHLCRRRNRANPVHIEFVPIKVNVLRGEGPAAHNARKTVCLRGHSFKTQPNGHRNCLECVRISDNKRRRQQGVPTRVAGFCRTGHELTAKNSMVDGRGKRCCRICRNLTTKLRRRKARESTPSRHNEFKTHCPKGHPYDAKNTGIRKRGGRSCKMCINLTGQAYWKTLSYDDPRRELNRKLCRERYHKLKALRATP